MKCLKEYWVPRRCLMNGVGGGRQPLVSVSFSIFLCHSLLLEASLTTFSLVVLSSALFPRP